jgi:hypothetical protein
MLVIDATVYQSGQFEADPVLGGDLLSRRSGGLVVQTGAADAEKVGLDNQRQLRAVPLDQRQPLVPMEVRGQIFFSHATCALAGHDA